MGKSNTMSSILIEDENNEELCETNNDNEEKIQIHLPQEMSMLENQVGGHCFNGKTLGMIKFHEYVLKPIMKKENGEREIEFYETIQRTNDTKLIEIRDLIPKYYGKKQIEIDNKQIDCIVLEDLTKTFREPCIMDIKIGRRTWSPNSTPNKILSEQMKYYNCKRDLGFFIPGFQVYNLSTNKLKKYDKSYGKKLDRDGAEEAIKLFLNANQGICRSLIVQILANLWRIQHWARTQRDLRIYSSSILIIYDARRLRECLKQSSQKFQPKLTRKNSLYRPLSLAVLNNQPEKIPTGFSGQLTKDGPILRSPTQPNKLLDFNSPLPSVNNNNVWQKSIRTLQRVHSFQNNYDKDLQNRKQHYTYILDELCNDDCMDNSWAVVKLIDFAHVHHANDCNIDRNYLEGVENLIKMFEEFLIDTE